MAKYINRRRTNTAAAVLSLAMVIVYALNLDFDRRKTTAQPPSKTNSPDRFARNIEIKQYDENGKLVLDLVANAIEYYDHGEAGTLNIERDSAAFFTHPVIATPKSEIAVEFGAEKPLGSAASALNDTAYARLQRPKLKVFSATDHAEMLADSALLFDNRQIQLLENVSVYESKFNSLLTTDSLAMDINLRQLLTQDKVTLSNEFSFSKATGMEANLLEGRWRLLSNVHSEVVPQ